MSKTIKINGKDFTRMFTPRGYVVRYESVQGNNGGLMLDGSTTEDELAIKAVVSLPVMPLNEVDVATLLQAIYSEPYVTLYFYDPLVGGYRETLFRRSQAEQKYRGFGSDGKEYWTGPALTLTEK